MIGIPSFDTDRLLLKPVTIEDEPAYTRHFVDYDVISQLGAVVPWPYPEGGVRSFLADVILPAQGRDRWVWGLFLKSNPQELIGVVDLWRHGRPENRGFWLGRKYWGQGLMTEAVEPVIDYAFESLGFETLIFSNALGNSKSRRVKEKTGARLIDVRPAAFVNPEYTHAEYWELRKTDWIEFRSVKLRSARVALP